MNGYKRFALIGCPLGHSLSPVIHKELLKLSGVNGEYSLIEIEPEKLFDSFSDLKRLNGFNVTIPHKTGIIPMLDSLSNKAELFGAVNTVEINDGKAIGHNTDCVGFLRALKSADIELSGRVLICGCGGVSRMFAFESALAGCDITFAIREKSIDKCRLLCDELKSKTNKESKIALIDEVEGEYDLIINGTPVGMYPKVDASPIKKEVVEKAGAVFDSIYNPEETVLLRYARESGIKHQNGFSMLVWQAAAAEEIWNDIKFNAENINEITEKLRVTNYE